MNNTQATIDNALASLITSSQEKGTKLIDWLYNQAPEFVNQLLAYHFIENLVYFIFGLFLIVGYPTIYFYLAKHFYYKLEYDKTSGEQHSEYVGPVGFIGLISSGVSFLVGIYNVNLVWLKIWIAPKVYLLEYLSNIIK